MTTARLLCAAVVLITGVHFATAIGSTGIHQGLGTDVFFAGYQANPWQAGINADLLSGLALFAGWILLRERSLVQALIWIALVFYWGNFTAALYVLKQLGDSGGRWDLVLLGHHAAVATAPVYRPWPAVLKSVLVLLAAALLAYALHAASQADFAFAPTMGYLGGIAGFAPALLRIAYLGRRVG